MRGYIQFAAASERLALATLVCLLCPPPGRCAGEIRTLEGFEDIEAVSTTRGGIAPVTDNRLVVQGKQAARMAEGASFEVAISPSDLKGMAWLKIDTATRRKGPHAVTLRLNGPGFYASIPAYVQADRIRWPFHCPPLAPVRGGTGPMRRCACR